MHPKERRVPWQASRREFLLRSGGAAAALTGAGALLAGCGQDTTTPIGAPGSTASTAWPQVAGIDIATRDHPVTLPLFDDNPPIADGLKPEAGPLQLYNWEAYINAATLKDFSKEYGVEVKVTTFNNMEEAVAKLSTGSASFDVFFPTIDPLPRLVAGKILQPLNHTYLPNLTNVWASLQTPFYDFGAQYTVPYTVYTTGIGWRNDKLSTDVAALDNPYDAFWVATEAKGKAAVLDVGRDALAMAMLRRGQTDLNTGDSAIIDQARDDLMELTGLQNIKVAIGGYETLPAGRSWLHQVWSGDLINAQYYLANGSKVSDLSYWYPEDGKGHIGNDTLAVLKGAKNPVLAHLLVNFLLDNDHSLDNFSWVGYQPPLTKLDTTKMVKDGLVPENLSAAVVKPEYFTNGYEQVALPPEVDTLWQDAWRQFTTGAGG
jgi:spermidine/putrescine transport system substrate-binding protein